MIKHVFLAAAQRSPRHHTLHHRQATRGFSLPQLLVYSVASTLLTAVAAATLMSNIRSNSNMELYQRAEERWSRISSLIQSETSEASSITYGESFPCSGYGSGINVPSSFKLVVPNLTSSGSSPIFFLKNGTGSSTQLFRCGLGYNADGTLRIGQDLILSTLGLRTDLVITNQAPDSFTFTLHFYSPSNQLILSRSATATVGVEPAQICNSAETLCAN